MVSTHWAVVSMPSLRDSWMVAWTIASDSVSPTSYSTKLRSILILANGNERR